jgi:hypothetical protein
MPTSWPALSSVDQGCVIAELGPGGGEIRKDGRVIHAMYLFEAKAPSKSKEEWDVAKVKGTIPD